MYLRSYSTRFCRDNQGRFHFCSAKSRSVGPNNARANQLQKRSAFPTARSFELIECIVRGMYRVDANQSRLAGSEVFDLQAILARTNRLDIDASPLWYIF